MTGRRASGSVLEVVEDVERDLSRPVLTTGILNQRRSAFDREWLEIGRAVLQTNPFVRAGGFEIDATMRRPLLCRRSVSMVHAKEQSFEVSVPSPTGRCAEDGVRRVSSGLCGGPDVSRGHGALQPIRVVQGAAPPRGQEGWSRRSVFWLRPSS